MNQNTSCEAVWFLETQEKAQTSDIISERSEEFGADTSFPRGAAQGSPRALKAAWADLFCKSPLAALWGATWHIQQQLQPSGLVESV